MLRLTFGLALLVTVGGFMWAPTPVKASPANTINFQARLENAAGAIAPDGDYNVEFKLYNGSSGGTALWTEDYLNSASNGVRVVNGYLTANLGSTTAFPSTINWGQKLYLTMNVGGTTTGAVTWDGEMSPRLPLTSVPSAFALNSYNGTTGYTSSLTLGQATGGNQTFTIPDQTAAGAYTLLTSQAANLAYIQNQNSAAQTSSNFWISGTGQAATLQGNTSVLTPTLDTPSGTTTLNIGQTSGGNATAISLNQNTSLASGKTLTVNGSGFDASGNLGVGTTSPTTGLEVAVNTTSVNTLPVLIQQAGTGNSGIEIKNSATSFYAGIDSTDNNFKISSATAAPSSGGTNVGDTTVESSSDFNAMGAQASKFTASASGNATSISIYFSYVDAANPHFYVGLYSDNGSGTSPSALLNTSAIQTATTGWNTVAIPSTAVTSGTIYWIAMAQQGDNNFRFGGSTGTIAYRVSGGYPLPNPFAADSSNNNGQSMSIYMTIGGTVSNDFGSTSLFSLSGTGQLQLKNSTNSTSAFTIQNANGVNLLSADTTNGTLQLGNYNGGTSPVAGQLVVANSANANTVTVQGGSTASSYNLFLPTGPGTTGQCLSTTVSGINSTLSWGACGGGTWANQQLSNLSGTVAVNLSLTPGTNNSIDLGSSTYNWRSGYFGTSVLTPKVDTASAVALSIGSTNASSVTIGKSAGTAPISLSASTINLGIATAATTLQGVTQTGSNAAGAALKLQGSTGNGTGQGGVVTLQAGSGGASGANGGNLNLYGGTGTGSGVSGLVVLNTPTFLTATADANCYTGGALVGSSCTISAASVNGSSAIMIGFSAATQTATLPDPTLTTAGRVIYITAANGSQDFTLLVNGGTGVGNEIAMRANTTATMIWNGTDWTAAGASSSTTLQSAYDNTLQSAGGAELVVSHTSATNGLTIRDSTVNPVNGTLLQVQSKTAANLFSVSSNVTDYASDPGAETAGGSSSTFPSSTWTAIGGSTVSRNTTTTNNSIATGQASVGVTASTAGAGVANQLINPNTGAAAALTANNHYSVSFAARLPVGSSAFTDMAVYYSYDGNTAHTVACVTGQIIAQSIWTKVNCTFTAPASGITSANTILIEQASAVSRSFYVDNLSVTIAADYNLATDGGVDDATNFSTNWPAVGSTVARSTSVGNDTSDSAQVTTTGANQGIRNKLSINPQASSTGVLYRVTVYVTTSSASFGGFTIRYSPNNGTNMLNCVDYNTQTVNQSATLNAFTEITCYVTTDNTTVTTPYVYFTQTDGTARTWYLDTFSMTLSAATTPDVQIGSGSNGGPTTLLTLDKAASAPIAANNDALLGSMYYDTTLGKLQCYEADGWGACGSSPDNIVTLSPEYTNAVLHGTGVGTMTSDFCSDALNINDGSGTPAQPSICGTNETYNFYKWTSPQYSAQTYSIYVTYQLPGTFKQFASGQTSIMGRTDNGPSTGSATVNYQVYRNNTATGLTACGSTVAVSTGTVTSWQTGIASGAADPSTCGFSPGDSIVFQINVTASQNAAAYVGNLNFTFSNR